MGRLVLVVLALVGAACFHPAASLSKEAPVWSLVDGRPPVERDPAEVTALAVPLGCPRPALPVARRALEYSLPEGPAVRLVFATTAAAIRFAEARLGALRGCVGRDGGPAVGPLVTGVRRVGAMVLSERTPRSDPWSEVAVRRGTDVLMVASATVQENTPPVAVDDTATVMAGAAVTIPVLANDIDDGPLTVVSTTGDARVSFTADSVTVQTGPADSGTYSFGYTVSDGELTASATVTVTIQAVGRALTLAAPPVLHALVPVTISASATPVAAVTVTLQRRVDDGPWQAVQVLTTGSDGLAAFTLTPQQPGRWQLRALGQWPDGTEATSDVLDRQVVVAADIEVSGPLTAADVPWSYRIGCPVGPEQLRRVSVTHVDYRGRLRRGTIVVAGTAVAAVSKVFTRALRTGFPIRRMVPADHYYADGRRTPTGSDLAAMRADNTSAFNCRSVTGNPYRLSQHSYGDAVDINTARNPYVHGKRVYPKSSVSYLDRRRVRPGMILRDGVVTRTFRNLGWRWGGRWKHPDYQHFSVNGR